MTALTDITNRIIERSKASREVYLDMTQQMRDDPGSRGRMSCSNWAHVVAASSDEDKVLLPEGEIANIGIVTAYNDMLSAHQPFASYPNHIKLVARSMGATAQVAGGVPAMCDGVTQGQPGMELSLISRDVIAMSTAVSLSHAVYDAVVCLGVCDKIAPGLVIGALQFGHLPVIFAPAGPMPSGITNKEKAEARQEFAAGRISKQDLQAVESAAYHSAGTCTFYGTANTNQLLLEALGLQIAGTSFVNPETDLRKELTTDSVKRVLSMIGENKSAYSISQIVNEKSIVNAIVIMVATGGSTNLCLHLISMAEAAGIKIDWRDIDEISKITPLLARVYPNGTADVNQFQAAGGLAHVVSELRKVSGLNEDVTNIMGEGLDYYAKNPKIEDKQLVWRTPSKDQFDDAIVSTIDQPFASEGGISLVEGQLGTAVVKVSAVDKQHQSITAPCKIFSDQSDFIQAYQNGELNCDHVAVVRFQGPASNGMPELHKLTPFLGLAQDQGYKVALVTDGRMSGASGKVLAAIHVTPEAKRDGLIAKLVDGDVITIDAEKGILEVENAEQIKRRESAIAPKSATTYGRGLFNRIRELMTDASDGGSFI